MSERLEEINSRTEFVEWEKGDIRAVVKSDDYRYLEDQAERYDECRLDAMKLHEENKRYRDVINKIANETNHNAEGLDAERELDRVTDMAYEALEQSNE